MHLVMLAVSGALGTLARYGGTQLCQRLLGPDFPWGTLVVNGLGSFLLGLLSHVLLHHPAIPSEWRVPMTTGFLGAFTTFSTFSVETVQLAEAGRLDSAIVNVVANGTLGLLLAAFGLALGRHWVAIP